MIRRRPNSLSLKLTQFLQQQQSLRLFGTRSSRRYIPKDDNDDYHEKNRKARDGDEGRIHLLKSRGQHILTNPRVLDAIVRKADIRPTDTVLEIGPGTGNLTLRLLQAAEKVVAIEIDKRMIEILSNRVSEQGLQNQLTIICKDALKTEFPRFDLVVANIPYGISSPLIAKLVFGADLFRSATLLLQKEFAWRLLANPGDSSFNRLAVNVKLVADVEFIMNVSKRDFVPIPKVDSSVVKIHPKAHVPDVDMDEWRAFTRACFSKKNKTLGATFKQKKKVMELSRRFWMINGCDDNVITEYNYNNDKEMEDEDEEEEDCSSPEMEMGLFRDKIIGVLREGGFEEKRPSKLSNEELLRLLSLFNQAGIRFHDQITGKREHNVQFAASCSS